MAETSLFFATDPAGRDACWGKLLQAQSRFGLDAVMVAGRLQGYGVQAVFPHRSGWSTRIGNRECHAATENELHALEAVISHLGLYPCRMDRKRFTELRQNPAELSALFSRLARESLTRWLDMAAAVGGLRLFAVLDDEEPEWVAEMVRQSPVICDLAGRVLPLDERHEAVGRSRSRPDDEAPGVPELPELFGRARDIYTSILCTPLPPHGSALDDGTFPDTSPHAAAKRRKVRMAIERFQPLVALCGSSLFRHAAAAIGRTLCLAPGKSSDGMLPGHIVVLAGTRVKGFQAVTG